MKKLYQLLVVVTTLSLANMKIISKPTEKLVSVQVYYESLCPDSIRFINNQLFPTYQKLGKYFKVEFVTFGKASFEPTETGGWTFSCQHGPDECTGNAYQSCLLDKLETDDLQVEAVNCIMASPEPDEATEECMEKLGITNPSYESVDECGNSVEGENLLQAKGLETHNLDPPLYFVPWITFDRVWQKDRMESALRDLEKSLCQNELSQVPECQKQ